MLTFFFSINYRSQLAVDRMLREEQEQAYQASLAADRELEVQRQQKLAEEEKKREEEETARLLQEQKEREAQNTLETKKSRLPQEPSSGEILSLAFRLPNGKRLQRKFAADNSVQVLYDFIDTHPDNPNKKFDPYTLSSNFPKQSFPPSNISLQNAGIPNHSVLDFIFD